MKSMKSPKVVVEGLCKVFGNNPKLALDMLSAGAGKDEVFAKTGQVVGVHKASFEVKEGEIFVLMGLSGSGKSTLIRLINRLVEPTAGKVVIDGRDIAAVRRAELTALRRTDMSMVFQSFALMPQRTVLSNASFGLEVAGVGRKDREKRSSRSASRRSRRSCRRNCRAACSSGSASPVRSPSILR
jgi:glycine betaine/proline transport system ATP-binding protein